MTDIALEQMQEYASPIVHQVDECVCNFCEALNKIKAEPEMNEERV